MFACRRAIMHATNAVAAAAAAAARNATVGARSNAVFVAFIRQQISVVSCTHTHTYAPKHIQVAW